MKNYDVWLAEQFKARENKSLSLQLIGIVKSKSPLIVSVDGGQINLDKRHLYITQSAHDLLVSVGENAINLNDELLLLPSENDQKYFIIDKVRKVV